MSKERRFLISSCSCATWALRVSFSAEYISTLACKLASHCFLRCRHLRAATLTRVSKRVDDHRPVTTDRFRSRKFLRFSSSVIFLLPVWS